MSENKKKSKVVSENTDLINGAGKTGKLCPFCLDQISYRLIFYSALTESWKWIILINHSYISFAIAAGENFAADSLGWKPQKGTSIF